MTIEALTNFLDHIHFCGLRIWDFGFRSLNREYSWFFLIKIIFKHPLKSLKGFHAYRKFCQSVSQISSSSIYSNISEPEFLSAIENDRSSLLVAMGYCQRPMKTENQPFACPSKRFSHDCLWIENQHRLSDLLPACSVCEIQVVAQATIEAGARFYIMTSAKDIARDIFIPTLASQKFRYAILFICPYSILPITLPLFICGINFLIIPYTIGDCRHYSDFVRADVGIKPQRTFPSGENFESVFNILKMLAQN